MIDIINPKYFGYLVRCEAIKHRAHQAAILVTGCAGFDIVVATSAETLVLSIALDASESEFCSVLKPNNPEFRLFDPGIMLMLVIRISISRSKLMSTHNTPD